METTITKKNMKARSTLAQIRTLINYMQSNVGFANGEFKSPMTQHEYNREWEQLRNVLKEYGADRSVTQWRNTWRDLKKRARHEFALVKFAETETGNDSVPELTEQTKVILSIIDSENEAWPEIPIGEGAREAFKIVQKRNEKELGVDRMSLERSSNDSPALSLNDMNNKLTDDSALEYQDDCDDHSGPKKQCYESKKYTAPYLNTGKISTAVQPATNGNSNDPQENSQLWNANSNYTTDLFGRIVTTELSSINTMNQYDCMKDILEVIKKYQKREVND